MPKNNFLNNNPLNKTGFIIFTLLLPLFLLLLSYKLTLAIYPLLSLPTSHQQNTFDFLQGRIEATALTVHYNEQELSHLYDVQQVMQWADVVFLLLLLASIALLYHSKTDWKKYLRWGGITTVAIVSFIILLLLLSFNMVFTLFHLLFFPQGNWIFPADSMLIQTFPLEFFVRMGMIIFGGALGLGILMLLLPKIMGKLYKGEEKGKDLEMKTDVKAWWTKAKDDFEKAEILFNNKKYDGAVFFCQQAVEKGMKAILLGRRGGFRKIHDLVELGNEISLPEHLLNYCKELTLGYLYSRYPEIRQEKDINAIAKNFLKYAREILLWLETRI